MAGRFRWRARNIVRGGEDSQGDWQVGTGSLLVVGDTDIEVREVSVLLLDAGEHLGGTLSLTLHGAPAGLPTRLEHMLDGGEVEVVLRVPVVRGGAGLWTVEAAVWDLQGEEIRFGPTESSDEVVVLVPSGP